MLNRATLIVDMQNDFVADGGVLARAGMDNATAKQIVPCVRELVQFSRSEHIPIVWIKMVWGDATDVGLLRERSTFLQEEGLRRGSWGAELVEGLAVQPGDVVIEKQRFSAFYNTQLDAVLRERKVEELLVGGVRMDFCVESTVRDAFFRDYRVIIVRDCVAGYFPDMHEAALKTMNTVFAKVMDLEEVKDLIARSKREAHSVS